MSALFAGWVSGSESGFWKRARRGDLIALLCLVQGGCWVGTGARLGGGLRGNIVRLALVSDLKNLASQQEIYYHDARSYTTVFADLAFTNSDGVMVDVDASEDSWSARTTHGSNPDISCAMYWGDVANPKPTLGGVIPKQPGEMLCEPWPLWIGEGWVGDFIPRYHRALRRRFR